MKRFALRNLVLVVVLALGFCTGCDDDKSVTEPAAVEGKHLLAVAGDATLSIYDLDNEQWTDIPFGLGNAPNWMVAKDNNLYVVNSLSNDLHHFIYKDNEISLVDRYDLGLAHNRNPFCVALHGDHELIITNLLENTLSVFNLEEKKIVASIPVGQAPEEVVVAGDVAWVMNAGYDFTTYQIGDGVVQKVDLNERVVVGSVSVGLNAQFAALDAEGRLHVVCTGDYGDNRGKIVVLDAQSLTELERIPVEGYPGRIAIDNGRASIAGGGWYTTDGARGAYFIYDTGDLEISPPQFTRLGVMEVLPDGNSLYALCRDVMSVEVLVNGQTVRSIALEDAPNDILVWDVSEE